MRKLFEYLMPTKCRDAMKAAYETNRRVCENIVCLIDNSKEKIIHEMSTPNASKSKSVVQLHAK